MFLTSLYRGVHLALFACTLAIPASVGFAQSVTLQGHMPAIVSSAQRLNRVNAAEQISLALVLPLRNQDQLADLLHRLYTPGDLMYGKYLTPDQFAQQFSPSQADYQNVIAFAQSQGLSVTATHPNRTVVDVAGSAQAVENAFGVQLHQYQVNGGRTFRAPSNEPQIPTLLAGRLAAVIGLDTAAVWRTHNVERPIAPVGGPKAQAVPHNTGSGPGGGLTPADIKTAYSLNGIGANGAGQSLALFELSGYTASDITNYENYYGLPNVPVQNVLIDGYSGAPGPGSGPVECTLDIELQIALAPNASKIYVYEGPNSGNGVIDTYNRIATDNLAKSVSTSWGLPEFSNSSSARNGENQAFQQMAAQGQSIFAASGDSGAYDNGSTLSVDDPASQPYMTGVGATSLTTNGAGGAWSAETTWNNGSGASGGGNSLLWAKPSYQANFGASSTNRNVPDVSLDGDPYNGYSVFYGGGWGVYGGTSCAAPLWSAFVACVNQSRVAAGKSTLGFANPVLYQLGAGANYATDFHDIADNSTNQYYHATTGYDNATGWGSFNGTGLFPDLVNGGASGTAPAPSAPTSLAATAGNAQVSLSWNAVSGATSYKVYRSTTNGSGYAVIGTATTTTYLDTAATNATTYYYVVTAVNANGESPKSAQVSATPTAPSQSATVYKIHAGGGVIGAFNPDSYFTGGELYFVSQNIDTSAPNAAPMAVYQTQRYGNFSYVMPNLTPGTSYTVRLHFAESYFSTPGQRFFNVAINGATVLANFDIATVAGGVNKALVEQFAATADSSGNITILFTWQTNWPLVNAVEIIGGASGTAPAPSAPTSLAATAGNAQVSLSWNAVSGATSYNVYRSTTNGSGYAVIGTATTTTYLDTAATNATTYYYVVTAVNANGESPKSAQVSATPTAPSQSATVYKIHAGGGVIGAFNPDSYFTGGELYFVSQNIDTSAPNAAPMAVYQTQRYGNFSYVMPNLTPGTSYTVRLHFAESYFSTPGQRFFNVAINGATVLANFDIATVAGGVNKALVEQFAATADSSGNITIVFTAQSNWPLVNAVEIIGGASGTAPAPSAPTSLAATAGNAQVSLSWNAVSGATSYKVYRSTTSGSGYTVVGTATSGSYLDTNVTNATTYYYVVTAVNTGGESPKSAQVSATPTAPSQSATVYKIHAGGGVIGAFNPDNYFTGGELYFVSQNIDTSAPNAAPMAVYQTQRYGNFSYVMPNLTPGTSYTVRLHFAESYFSTPGQRFFNVAINGATVLANFDIATVAGGVNKALVEQFAATADSSGNITIVFTAQSNWPLVNAVEILH